MLEYQKLILKKVCFDKKLFERELKKTLKWINPIQKKDFEQWVEKEFLHIHPIIIKGVFNKNAA
jgi:hypothetical protein